MTPIPTGQKKLAYYRSGSGMASRDNVLILNVVRYTATQVVCQLLNSEIRFNLSDGSERGGNYGSHAEVVTRAILDGIARTKLSDRIRVTAYRIEELARKVAHADRRDTGPDLLKEQLDLLTNIEREIRALTESKTEELASSRGAP